MPQDPAYMYSHQWMPQIQPPPHTLPPASPSHTHSHPNPNNVSSPPQTLSTTTAPPGPGGGGWSGTSRLNTGASTSLPRKVTIKSQDGREVDLSAWGKKDAPTSPIEESDTLLIHQTHQRTTSVVRMGTVEVKEERLAEEKEKEKEEKARGAKEKKKAAKGKKKRKAEEERLKKAEEAEHKREAEREEEEAERERVWKEEEKASVRKEEEAKKAAEEERKRKEKEEEERKAAKAEKLRLAKKAEERMREEAKVTAKLTEEQKPEEGEFIESPTSEESPEEVREVFSRKGLKFDTSITGGELGGERDELNKVHAANMFNNQAAQNQIADLEPVAPLGFSVNGRSTPALTPPMPVTPARGWGVGLSDPDQSADRRRMLELVNRMHNTG